jgi:hypothetical protein
MSASPEPRDFRDFQTAFELNYDQMHTLVEPGRGMLEQLRAAGAAHGLSRASGLLMRHGDSVGSQAADHNCNFTVYRFSISVRSR